MHHLESLPFAPAHSSDQPSYNDNDDFTPFDQRAGGSGWYGRQQRQRKEGQNNTFDDILRSNGVPPHETDEERKARARVALEEQKQAEQRREMERLEAKERARRQREQGECWSSLSIPSCDCIDTSPIRRIAD